jgi:hypothetical protein
MKDLENIPFTPDLRLASFDIFNMYTNIPINELLDITENACKNDDLEPSMRQEILRLTRLIVTQNYFKFQDKTYLQKNGLVMGAPQPPPPYQRFIYSLWKTLRCLKSSAELE